MSPTQEEFREGSMEEVASQLPPKGEENTLWGTGSRGWSRQGAPRVKVGGTKHAACWGRRREPARPAGRSAVAAEEAGPGLAGRALAQIADPSGQGGAAGPAGATATAPGPQPRETRIRSPGSRQPRVSAPR